MYLSVDRTGAHNNCKIVIIRFIQCYSEMVTEQAPLATHQSIAECVPDSSHGSCER